jgi:hypothetical protein
VRFVLAKVAALDSLLLLLTPARTSLVNPLLRCGCRRRRRRRLLMTNPELLLRMQIDAEPEAAERAAEAKRAVAGVYETFLADSTAAADMTDDISQKDIAEALSGFKPPAAADKGGDAVAAADGGAAGGDGPGTPAAPLAKADHVMAAFTARISDRPKQCLR